MVGVVTFVSGLVEQTVCCCETLEVEVAEEWIFMDAVSALLVDILGRVDEEVVMIDAATASRTAIRVSLMVAVTVVVEVCGFIENGR